MKLFVWQRIKHCTDNYHEEGGVVVVAVDRDHAVSLAKALGAIIEPTDVPDFIADVFITDDTKAGKAFLFPDAGCC